MLRGFKVRLDVNNKQTTALSRNAGAARWAWNWGLAEKRAAHERGERMPSAIDLDKRVTQMKQARSHAWLYDVSRYSYGQALRDLDEAYQRFFAARKAGMKDWGRPRFKSRHTATPSFTLYGSIKVWTDRVQLPNLGQLRLCQKGYIPADHKPKSATVSFTGGHWYVSILMDVPVPERQLNPHPLGVDMGFKTLAVISNGQRVDLPDEIKVARRKIERLQRALSRKEKGSHRREKAKARLARAHERLNNVRADTHHKLSARLTRNAVIGVEDLNVRGMQRNRSLARRTGELGLSELLRQITYKAERGGGMVVPADRFFPSTKTCSRCGKVRDIGLDERVYVCSECGLTIDRDLNAARNLKQLAANTAESLNARGESVRPVKRRRFSLKREASQSAPDSGAAISLAVAGVDGLVSSTPAPSPTHGEAAPLMPVSGV